MFCFFVNFQLGKKSSLRQVGTHFPIRKQSWIWKNGLFFSFFLRRGIFIKYSEFMNSLIREFEIGCWPKPSWRIVRSRYFLESLLDHGSKWSKTLQGHWKEQKISNGLSFRIWNSNISCFLFTGRHNFKNLNKFEIQNQHVQIYRVFKLALYYF